MIEASCTSCSISGTVTAAENAQIFDSTLSKADIGEPDALDRTGGTQRVLERKWC
jgi:hypothetical protein